MSAGAGQRRSKSDAEAGFPVGGKLLSLDESKRLSALNATERAAAILRIVSRAKQCREGRNVSHR